MDKRLCVYLLTGLFSLSGSAQDKPKLRQLTGKVAAGDRIRPVPFAFIADSQTDIVKETDDTGVFTIHAEVNDTLFFRCMTYEDTVFIVTEEMFADTALLCVKEKSYQIKSVDVLMFKSYASFRHMVANMDVTEDKPSLDMASLYTRDLLTDMTTLSSPYAKSGVGVNLIAVPALIVNMLSKRKPRLSFTEKAKLYERYYEMTSRENMKYLTKLDSTALDSFMIFLRTNHEVNPNLSDYKMMEAVNNVFEEFRALRGDALNASQ